MNATTSCWIYKGTKRDEMYLYVDREDDFAKVPAALLTAMGELELVMSLELHPGRKLARADVGQVMTDLASRGYFLQLPPPNSGSTP